MSKRYTISDIKCHNQEIGHYYFGRSTMKFFGQKMKDFRVRHVANRIFIWSHRPHGISFAEYNPVNGHINCVRFPDGAYEWTYSSIQDFLNKLKEGD